jgi:hypothetical protein
MNDSIKSTSVKKMKTEHEIRKRLEDIENELLTNGPFREWETITRKATKQALEWVLEETEILLNC